MWVGPIESRVPKDLRSLGPGWGRVQDRGVDPSRISVKGPSTRGPTVGLVTGCRIVLFRSHGSSVPSPKLSVSRGPFDFGCLPFPGRVPMCRRTSLSSGWYISRLKLPAESCVTVAVSGTIVTPSVTVTTGYGSG